MTQALLIFKPDASYRRAVRGQIWSWLGQRPNVDVEALRWFQPGSDLIESHYDFLRGRPFFPWLVDFMSAFPLLVGKLSADPTSLEQLRYDLGETRINESRPGSLRERFGIYGGINCLHVSDSPESGEKEVELWAQHLSLSGIDADPGQDASGPDHTFHLRSLAGQLTADKHADLARAEIGRLLAEETGLQGDRLQKYLDIILGAFA